MKMQGMRDGCVVAVLLLASVLDVGGLDIKLQSARKVVSNETFIVVCTDDKGLALTWRGPKGILGPKTRPVVDTKPYGTSIVFNGSRMEDTGDYTCSNGKEHADFHLTVENPLKFTDTATNQTAIEGNEFNVKCEVRGGTVSWLVEGGGIIEDNEKYAVLGDGLLIKNVSLSDARTYICKGVQQTTGIVQDREIHLRVRHKPVHPIHQTKRVMEEVVWGDIGGTVNLTCNVLANPPAKFEWRSYNNTKKKIAMVTNETENLSILHLRIDNSTFGDYKCVAKNTYGTYEKWFRLERGIKPAPPKNFQLKTVTHSSLVLEIVAAELAPEQRLQDQGFNVQYKKVDQGEWKQQEFNVTQDNLYTLDGLESNSEYDVQAATVNAAGLSEYVALPRFKTSTGSSVHLTWPLLYSVAGIILFQMRDHASW